MKVLCTGDLHIGRRSSKVLDEQEARRHSAAAVWESIVELALRETVDLVALTGDVVDRDNRYFEAIGPLERGLVRLADAAIDVVAVAGNHDFDVLPRLVDRLPGRHVRLLGQGGAWEEVIVQRPSGAIRVRGWSFPDEHYAESPIASYDFAQEQRDGARTPTLVLVHGDLDNAASRYAPIMLRELSGLSVTACLLGHVHRPMLHAAEHGPTVLYPGSPQALDPGETGPHGPWLLELDGATNVRARHVPLSRIRYEEINVDLDGVATTDEVETRLGAAVREQLAEACATSAAAELLSLRIRFTGRTALAGRLPRELPGLLNEYSLSHGSLKAQIEKLLFDTRPAIDLDELARACDVPGTLARLILDLDSRQCTTDVDLLVAETHRRLHDVHHASAFEPVMDDPPPDLAAARLVLRDIAMSLLDALLAQKEPA